MAKLGTPSKRPAGGRQEARKSRCQRRVTTRAPTASIQRRVRPSGGDFTGRSVSHFRHPNLHATVNRAVLSLAIEAGPSSIGMLEGTVASILLIALGLALARLAAPWILRTAGWSAAPNEGSDRLLRAVVEHSAVGIALLDRSSSIVHANAAFERILGYQMAELSGRRITDFSSAEDAEAAASMVRDVSTQVCENGAVETRFVRRDGCIAWGALSVSSAGENADGQLVAVLQDVTERKALEAKLVHQATHDSLTQLPNRALFRERVDHALSRSAREAARIAVIFLDLDTFKVVNDTQGHGAGDRLLQVVAQRLLSATRGCDSVARLGGDEFAVLLEQVDALGGAEAAVMRIISSLRQPVELAPDQSVSVCASFGISVYSGMEGAEELLRNADVAMYEAKQRSPGRWVVFDPSMQTALSERVTLEADLRRALERCQLLERPHLANTGVFTAYVEHTDPGNEFAVWYQPIVDLASGEIVAIEALARWTHPTRGAIGPELFIPVAERSGMIVALGRWVLREACRQAAQWNASRGESPLRVTVNLSGKQLEHEGIAEEVASVLHETALRPDHLILEITETVIMQNAESTLARLRELKRLGVGLAIDDFGTGYSSLSYLQRFPVNIVKIDRVFADGLLHGEEGVAIIRTILALAEMLKLRTIAEGVENACQAKQLKALGCYAGQGYLFGRPLTPLELEALLPSPAKPARKGSRSVVTR